MSKIKGKYLDETTIKTVNGQSIIGSGNITIEGGDGETNLHIGSTAPEDTSKIWVMPNKQVDFLSTDNQTTYTPTQDYHPATKKYVDDIMPEDPEILWGQIQGDLQNQEDLFQHINKNKVIIAQDFGAIGDGIANDTMALQAALDHANSQGGGMVYIPAGTYLIEDILLIYSNTVLTCAHNTYIKRNAHINAMIINGNTNVNGYEGQSNIIINGGEWDANATEFPSVVTPIAFGHARNVVIKDLLVKDVYDWHHIELNAVQNGQILNCKFTGMVLTRDYTEMVQIDLMISEGAFPWFGNYDGTPCDNITISGCTFEDGDTAGIGTHSSIHGVMHNGIKIIDNHFSGLTAQAVHGLGWSSVHAQGNTVHNCHTGFYFRSVVDTILEGVNISNNTIIFGPVDTTSRGIHISCSDKTFGTQKGIVVHGNIVKNAGRHGIGVDRASEGSISENTVTNCGGTGIWSWNSDNITLTGNKALFNNVGGLGEFSDMQIGGNSIGTNMGTAFNIATGNIVGTFIMGAGENTILGGNHFIDSYTSIGLDSSTTIIDGSGDGGTGGDSSGGGVVDSGMNSLGYWYRLADGTQHCYTVVREDRDVTGNLTTYIEFPQPFAAYSTIPPWNDAVLVTLTARSVTTSLRHNSNNITDIGFDLLVYSSTTTNRILHIHAVGRWD